MTAYGCELKGAADDRPSSGVGSRVAGCAQRAAGQREGIHAPERRAERGAPQAAVGEGGEGVHLRKRERKEDAGPTVWAQEPVDRLSLHVRPGMGGRLPKLLLPGRSLRWKPHPSGASRRDADGDIAGADPSDSSVPEAHGLAVSVGVVEWKRFQLRLPGVV